MTQVRIKQRVDSEANWLSSDVVLLSGELAFAVCESQIKIKVGDGTHIFSQLPYIDQNVISTILVDAHSVSQGTKAYSSSFGLAAGYHLSAAADYSQAMGVRAKTVPGESFSFVWNGNQVEYPPVQIGTDNCYSSHGEGTFNINPLSGLSGFYIGEKTLASALAESGSKVFVKNADSSEYVDGKQSDLSVIKLTKAEYAEILNLSAAQPNAIYVISNDCIDAYGERIVNLAPGTDLSDAVNLEQLSSAISSIQIPTDLSSFSNSPRYLVSNDISDYYTKSETSSSTQLTSEFANKLEADDVNIRYDSLLRAILLSSKTNITSVDCNDFIKDGMLSSVELCGTQLVLNFNTDAESQPISIELSNFVDNYDSKIEDLSTAIDQKIYVDGLPAQKLSVTNISQEDFYQKVVESSLISNELYVVSCNYINAYGEQIKNVAPGTELSDAVNLQQLSNAVSSIHVPLSVSELVNDSGYLTSCISAVSASYGNDHHIYLSANGSIVGDIDCANFIKDGMLSSVELCAGQLVFTFNADASAAAISVALSSFIDETQYWKKSETSSAAEISIALEHKASVTFVEWED